MSEVKVFVGNLPFTATEDEIIEHFSSVGEVLHVELPLNPRGQPKGFALVEFNIEDAAEKAITEFNQTDFKGRTIFVKKDEGPKKGSRGATGGGSGSRSPSPRRQPQRAPRGGRGDADHKASSSPPAGGGSYGGYQVYVGNLPWRTSWQDLKDTFSEFGEVLRANVIKDESGRSRGFGTVRFAKEEDAQKAIAEMDQQEFNGRTLSVRMDRYQDK
eukprot:TRINITY_DN5096_c0_g1_i2.p1 TRINITY_DN5096_c0_g1~~TRINITY_DN5096_c0_g1_i2.p1  ORF type:complete len:215 (-),score=60.70 TRINITY_DN5096_c0_g1_i2:112-756(-)